ncbi:helix-turn-helix transcriptional regulator [Flavobacterium sp. ALJ2]|uniref:helix-turn-helix transcriptional regulator n=1 Tax=Flavobacterium sp. ALJ2 TaxID=2786960 RepID=UPI00189FA436|nr:AraC family transcriptional regulator [Flavobacterium sp. ALJ2]MBF7093330.1 helix-turn-helix transcriptional regulator [Flavobacterium sp. ALJ2]
MQLKTTIKDIDYTLCDKVFFGEDAQSYELIEEINTYSDLEYGTIKDSHTLAGSFFINCIEVDLLKPIKVEYYTDEPVIQMFFFMKGCSNLMHHQIHYLPAGIKLAKLPATSTVLQYLSILISQDNYTKLVDSLDLNFEFISTCSNENPAKQIKHTEIMSTEILATVRDIVSCERTGHFRRIYMETKVTELLLLQVEQLIQTQNTSINIPKIDIERMYHARELVMQNIITPCSLIDLARKVGTNEFKLKKHFKELFGTTVFGYLNELKMNEAKQKLLKDELNIYQIAESLGYKTPNHFSTAFRKYFGYPPSQIKNHVNQLASGLTKAKEIGISLLCPFITEISVLDLLLI